MNNINRILALGMMVFSASPLFAALCADDPTNYVCNGGFEKGEMGGFFKDSIQIDFGCPSNIDFWCVATTSPDIIRRDNTQNHPFFHYNNNVYPNLGHLPDTHNGSPNDRYLLTYSYGNNNAETAYTQLIKPLTMGRQYELSFYFYSRLPISLFTKSGTNFTQAPKIYLTAKKSDIPFLPMFHQHQVLSSNISIFPDGWQKVVIKFEPTSNDYQYLILDTFHNDYGIIASGYDDIVIREIPRDFADAPDQAPGTGPGNYQTVVADNGASHVIGPDLRLGMCVDADPGTLQGVPALADDQDVGSTVFGTCAVAGDDEDGIGELWGFKCPGSVYNIRVHVRGKGFLNAWADWSQDGDWLDENEHVIVNKFLTTGYNQKVQLYVPSGIKWGKTYLRFRLTSQSGIGPVGPADDGEVEDYLVGVGMGGSQKDDGGDGSDQCANDPRAGEPQQWSPVGGDIR